jgi:hypothetical protein
MKKALKVFLLVVVIFIGGCATTLKRGERANPNSGLIAASAIVGAAILGHAYLGSKKTEVQKEAIRASVVLEGPCRLGPNGSVVYESTEGSAEAKTSGTLSPEDCERLIKARQQHPLRVGAYHQDPYTICDQSPTLGDRNNCRRNVERQIAAEVRRRATEAARHRY